jgi:hypothetical protein
MKRILKGKKMAHRGICPDKACELVDIEVKRQKSKREAFRVVAEELGVSPNTVKSWAFRNKVGAIAPTKNESTQFLETKTSVIANLHTLTVDTGRKKINFELHDTDGNQFLAMQEHRIGRKGEEIPTKNRFTMPVDLISQFRSALNQVEALIQERCSAESGADVPDHEEDDEVEPVADTDEGGTPENDPDGLGVETAPSPSSTDATEDAAVESELIQCVDCVHFAVKKGAPEENGACNSKSGSWDGKVFQPPQEPHPCPNFQREEHE